MGQSAVRSRINSLELSDIIGAAETISIKGNYSFVVEKELVSYLHSLTGKPDCKIKEAIKKSIEEGLFFRREKCLYALYDEEMKGTVANFQMGLLSKLAEKYGRLKPVLEEKKKDILSEIKSLWDYDPRNEASWLEKKLEGCKLALKLISRLEMKKRIGAEICIRPFLLYSREERKYVIGEEDYKEIYGDGFQAGHEEYERGSAYWFLKKFGKKNSNIIISEVPVIYCRCNICRKRHPLFLCEGDENEVFVLCEKESGKQVIATYSPPSEAGICDVYFNNPLEKLHIGYERE